MKKIFLIVFCLNASVLFAQQPVIWYFGYFAGIDFSSGSAVALTNGKVNQWEGVATACDTAGNLLFYSDGIRVWNKNHLVMPNGNGLLGNGSSTHSATVAPYPGKPNQYFLLTCPEISTTSGFRYSIIDMTLNGGLGDVTLTKNILLEDTTTEQCTVIPSSNGFLWIVTRAYQPKWFAYPLDTNGIGTPVISTAGSVFDKSQANGVGYMKASPLHNQIAIANYGYGAASSFFEFYSFDNTTGVVSNAFQVHPNPGSSVYSGEYSPDGLKFYGAEWGSNNNIYQYDLTAGSASLIEASQVTIGTAVGVSGVGDMQIAPDKKIYIAINGGTYLSTIDSPNVLGVQCTYNNNSFYLAGKSSGIGLPPTIIFPQLISLLPVAAFTGDTSTCPGTCVDFTSLSTNATTFLWEFPGAVPSTSILQNPTNICYSLPGSYDVTLIASNGVGSDTIVMNNFVTVTSAPIPNITQSNDTLYSSAGNSYQWYTGGNPINGATDDFYVPSTEDFYSVVITDANGCTAADTIFFSLSPQTSFATSDTTICQKFCMDFFDQSGNNPTTWQWSFPGGVPSSSNQQNPTQICYNNPGVYDVTLITTNSFGSDTLVLTGYITVYSTPAFPTITVTGDVLTSSYASSYQWQFNSADIPGATNQSYTATQTGYYTVIITDENGCVSSTTVFVEVTGIESIGNDLGFSVYPNPSNGDFIVVFSEPKSSEPISLNLVNELGQTLFSFTEIQQQAPLQKEIHLSNLPAGIYFITIQSENLSRNKKILVSK